MIEKILFSKVAYAFNKAHQLPKINHITTNITILSNYKHNNTKGHEANHNYDTKHLNK